MPGLDFRGPKPMHDGVELARVDEVVQMIAESPGGAAVAYLDANGDLVIDDVYVDANGDIQLAA